MTHEQAQTLQALLVYMQHTKFRSAPAFRAMLRDAEVSLPPLRSDWPRFLRAWADVLEAKK